MSDEELSLRAKAVDRIADQFSDFVVKHIPGRLVVTTERLYGQRSVNTTVLVPGGAVMLPASYQCVEIVAEPVPAGWAYARSPQDLMRA